MKILGIIGGVGPESTIDYYKTLISIYRQKVTDGSYPPILINSINLQKMVDLITAKKLEEVADYLLTEIDKLKLAGADFGLISANTPHIVFDDIKEKSPIPLISIIEAACDEVKSLGVSKAGLLGTKFTMSSKIYDKVFEKNGIEILTPDSQDRELIHYKYMNELIKGNFTAETKKYFLNVVDHLINEHDIECLILGGTELPLLLRDKFYRGIRLIDTTLVHVEAAVAKMLT
jgi:aspartate racemase